MPKYRLQTITTVEVTARSLEAAKRQFAKVGKPKRVVACHDTEVYLLRRSVDCERCGAGKNKPCQLDTSEIPKRGFKTTDRMCWRGLNVRDKYPGCLAG